MMMLLNYRLQIQGDPLNYIPAFKSMIYNVSSVVVVIAVTLFKTTYSISAPHAKTQYSGRE